MLGRDLAATPVAGRWFYLYLILDLYSRKVVGHEVHEVEAAEHAAHLVKRTALAGGVHAMVDGPVLHGDNGGILKATTVLAMLHWLGIAPSYSRPRVSDDNAFVESLFRTAKYRPGYPANGFKTLDDARQWAARFVHRYNHDHRHSGIRYVAPAQRHTGDDHPILAERRALYQAARQRHPRRWTTTTRNWTPIGAVTLNPRARCCRAVQAHRYPSRSVNFQATTTLTCTALPAATHPPSWSRSMLEGKPEPAAP